MATGDHLQVAVADGETIGVVQDLYIVSVAFGEIDWIVVFPMVVVLMVGDGADAAWSEVEGRMAEVVIVVDGRLEQCGDERIVDEAVA